MRAPIVCAALMAAVLPRGAGAQTVSLTEAQALALIGAESPRVVAARAAVDVARADVLAAGRWPNPRVTFNREAVAGIAENLLTVSQVLPITGRRGLSSSAASALADATASRAEDRIRRLQADARLAFTDLWTAQVRERELTRSRDRLRELADVLRRREAAGEAAGFDLLRVEREVIDVDADLASAATDKSRAQAALASYFARALDAAVVEAVRTARPPPELVPVEDLIAHAESTRGEIVSLTHELAAASFADRAAARRVIPEPEFVAGTKSSNFAGGDVGSVVSVHASVPLFDRAQPERSAAQARARQVNAELEALRRSLRAQVTAWRAAVADRRETADRYRLAASATADQIERIALVGYEAGERDILDLLDAHRTATSARMRQAVLDAGVREAEIELEFVSGWEMP
jgi:cobalt-zinc-cadmium efflux system outer membrane protein